MAEEQDKHIRVVDTTLRDGQMSLWATSMTTGMILPIADRLDHAGFDAAEVLGSSFFKKCVRELRDDPWERVRLLSSRMKTPLRTIKTRHIAAFQVTPPTISRLWMQRLAANGMRQVRMSDPSNTVANLKEQVRIAREFGMDSIVNLIFSISPKHTDAYYAERARALGEVDAMRLCLKDPGGLLTPERTRTLTQALLKAAGGRPLEIHAHCNSGLGPINTLEAMGQGIRIVNTAIPPLAHGASLPSVTQFVENARALGYSVELDMDDIRAIERHFRRIAARDGFPEGKPAEYDVAHYQHQVPGGMISNFRFQLKNLGMEGRVPEVLEETARVRADLGYPIMVTPYSQFVGSQAAINVIVGERDKEVTDELIHYALGHWGGEEADGIDPNVKDRILGRSRAKELAAQAPQDMTVNELRAQLGAGPDVDDDELLLRYLVGASDVAAMRNAGPIVEDPTDEKAVVALIRSLARTKLVRSIQVAKPGFQVTMMHSSH